MPQYRALTPIKTGMQKDKQTPIVAKEGDLIDLTEAEAAELLAIKAISGPVEAPAPSKK